MTRAITWSRSRILEGFGKEEGREERHRRVKVEVEVQTRLTNGFGGLLVSDPRTHQFGKSRSAFKNAVQSVVASLLALSNRLSSLNLP